LLVPHPFATLKKLKSFLETKMPTINNNLPIRTIAPKYDFLNHLGVGFDIVVLVTWAAISLAYSFTIGRRRGPILLLSTYAGWALTAIISTLDVSAVSFLAGAEKSEYYLLLLFLFSTVLAFAAFIRIVSRHAHIHSSRNGTLLLGALEAGAFLSSVGSLLPTDLQKMIDGIAGTLFTLGWVHIIWLVLPLFVLLIGEYRHGQE
jgi:hypothetical protein